MLLATPACAAEQDTLSGYYWVPRCKAFLDDKWKDQTALDAFYAGECLGLINDIRFMQNVRHRDVEYPWLCARVPRDKSAKDVLDVVLKPVEDDPKNMNQDFRMMVMIVFAGEWPCRPSNERK